MSQKERKGCLFLFPILPDMCWLHEFCLMKKLFDYLTTPQVQVVG